MSERLLVLLRHGESDFGTNDLAETPHGPQWDPPLSEKGREQAALLARRLIMLDPRPRAVYASPLRRARQTADVYAELAHLDVAYDDDLTEAHMGAWEAMSFEDILATDDELLQRLRRQMPIWSRAPGGEEGPAFRARVVGAIERILKAHPDGDVLVFCHGGVINAYCGQVLGIAHEMFFLPENTSVNSVEVDGAGRRIRFLNDVVHLTDPHWFEP
ncbi:MAG: histidine phosphatase family protein [Actinobacteria bacterium]|nr:histidine phosphatase family protein [Actinomycetota bacterium]